jgi:oligopeptide transport system ATP-binding protein
MSNFAIMSNVSPLLEVRGLRTCFDTREGVVRAVDGVSFSVAPGETVGIVGESGSGKSVLNYTLLRLLPMPPARIAGGTAMFDGVDLLACGAAVLRGIRGRRISMIFQDPMTALNPFMPVGRQVAEPLRVHGGMSRGDARDRALAMLEAVGIPDAAARTNAYPHEFSGGMRQRVMIAMALVAEPKLLIADEPTTALDVTVQAQILDRIRALQRDLGMAVVLVTHDLAVVAGVCARILVMYAGRILESGATAEVLRRPRHPYTAAMLDSLPATHRGPGPLRAIPGQPPNPADIPAGCPFAPRCAHAEPHCRVASCTLEEVAPGHATACIRVQEGTL